MHYSKEIPRTFINNEISQTSFKVNIYLRYISIYLKYTHTHMYIP